ncbi:ABC transporter ATP-binding protein [Carnobacteriaceae bacterium zg-ZUI252]|nr:ABC transporter ATP-binding protein [Carnobacteriaceae bacterium zg-ZUI252]
MMQKFIEVNQLSVFAKNNPEQKLVNNVSFSLAKGSVLGLVGESGSGKSLSVKSLMGILPENLDMTYDQLNFNGTSIQKNEKIPFAMIFQDPMTSLNPLRTIGFHLLEIIERFEKITGEQAIQHAVAMLDKVGITQPELRMRQYPFELSGGMRQRVMIAMALLAKPEVLIADEPTTALDVTIQLQILSLILKLQKEMGLTVIIVSHDFGVIASLCDDVVVMNNGLVVESGTVDDIFTQAQHPYTKRLMALARFETDVPNYVAPQQTELVKVSQTHFVRKEVSHD